MANIYKISLKALRRVVEKSWPLTDALQRDERINALDVADKELVEQLLTETLRHFGEISSFIKEPNLILMLGVAAMKILKIAPKQAINQLVELDENPKYRIILNRLSQKEFKPDLKQNYQNWMIGSWRKAYGEEKLQQIIKVMMQPSAELKTQIYVPSSETGNISAKPEILIHCGIGNIKPFVEMQKKLIEEAYQTLKSGQVFNYSNLSLQYEEGEGLIKKLDPAKWHLIEQTRILPCLDSAGNAIAGSYTAKLEKQ